LKEGSLLSLTGYCLPLTQLALARYQALPVVHARYIFALTSYYNLALRRDRNPARQRAANATLIMT
jgi:hypothetical protein